MQSNRWGSKRARHLAVALAALVLVGTVGTYLVIHGKAAEGSPGEHIGPNSEGTVSVELTSPRPGGIDRVCLQPGSVEPLEAADLYSKVSGFLAEQKVDIGSYVRAGDVLARISVPEYEKQVKQEMAEVERALARVEQTKAAIVTAKGDLGAATATVALVHAQKQNKASYRAFLQKQRGRIDKVVAEKIVDAQTGDEMQFEHEASISADLAASEAIVVAEQKEVAAKARVEQAQADFKFADADVATARARLEKSQVLLDYAVIRSPYTGVVTKRNFFPGDFIRSADAGGERMPLLAVERTDVMRVIVQVPERDVPLVDGHNPAVVEVDALPGVVFKTRGTDTVEVSRFAASEDPFTRMMRTEVDVKNSNGKLRRGMFGRVTITLQLGAPEAFRIPSSALSGKAEGGRATIRVIRNDKVALVPILYGTDNGSEVEILSGLTSEDRVVVRAAGPLKEGDLVSVVDTPSSSKTGR